MGDAWGSPLKPKKVKKETEEKFSKPKELPKFKPIKLSLPKSEARKILGKTGVVSLQETAWVQRWLETRIAEKSYPPSFAGKDAFGQIQLFLGPNETLHLLEEIRANFPESLPKDKIEEDFSFLNSPLVQADTQRLLQDHSPLRASQSLYRNQTLNEILQQLSEEEED